MPDTGSRPLLPAWLRRLLLSSAHPQSERMYWYRRLVAERAQLLERRRIRAAYPGVTFHGSASASADCSFDEEVVVWEGTRLSDCSIGRYTYFAPGSRLHNVSIGAFCSIGPEVLVGLGVHPAQGFVSTHPSFYSLDDACKGRFVRRQKIQETRRTVIGNDVWLGARALVADGVTIGDGAIIGAGAVVSRDVSPYSIVGGVPARLIRLRFDERQIDFLRGLAWWHRSIDWIQEHAELFEDVDLLRSTVEHVPVHA